MCASFAGVIHCRLWEVSCCGAHLPGGSALAASLPLPGKEVWLRGGGWGGHPTPALGKSCLCPGGGAFWLLPESSYVIITLHRKLTAARKVGALHTFSLKSPLLLTDASSSPSTPMGLWGRAAERVLIGEDVAFLGTDMCLKETKLVLVALSSARASNSWKVKLPSTKHSNPLIGDSIDLLLIFCYELLRC